MMSPHLSGNQSMMVCTGGVYTDPFPRAIRPIERYKAARLCCMMLAWKRLLLGKTLVIWYYWHPCTGVAYAGNQGPLDHGSPREELA